MLELILVVGIALAFDFTNGFHDAANAIATSVTTRSISPRVAVVAAGALNFVGAFLSLKVAKTIGKGILDPHSITMKAILAGLLGAIAWNLFTWWRGLPTSSSHALVGGVGGAAIVASGGLGIVKWHGLVTKVLEPSVAAPILGFVLAAVLALALSGPIGRWLDARPRPLKGLQLCSAGFVALTHGTNDAQKTMGVIALALVASGHNAAFQVDDWVIAAAAIAMALGTYVGGWRIVNTLGRRIADLDLRAGVAAQSAAAAVLFVTAQQAFPVSTTHTVTGSVLGSGSKRGWRGTHWGVAGRVASAWVITMPSAAAVGAGLALLLKLPGGEVLVLALAAGGAYVVFRARATLFVGWEQIEVEAPATAGPALAVPVVKKQKAKRPKAIA